MNYSQVAANEFAQSIKELGFRVFLAKSGTYGIITDAEGTRVLSFSFDGLTQNLSGSYGPPSRESGTGWRLNAGPSDLMTRADVEKALRANPPEYCGRGWKRFTSLAEHLASYGESSGYAEVL